jgi:hypothetical protein
VSEEGIIEATSGAGRTMGDGTLRLPVNIAAELAQAAFDLFGSRGTPMALIALRSKDEAEAIEGASGPVQTMAKGALRLSVDIDPRFARAAFKQFGTPGAALALAALKTMPMREREAKQRMEARGGSKAALAAQWCNDEQFQQWLQREPTTETVWLWALDQSGPGSKSRAELSAMVVREICGVESRSHLDVDSTAWECFNKRFRQPFMAWKEKQR